MRAPAVRRLIEQVYEQLPLKRRVFEIMRRTVRLPRKLTSHLRFQGTFTVDIDRAHNFLLQHWGYMVENDLFWNGFGNGYEGTSFQIWSRLALHAQVIVDVGANTGIYSLIARSMNPTATVVALEPVDRVFRRLQRNVELNGGNVILYKLAASNVNGLATLYDQPSDHEYMASLDHNMAKMCGCTVEYGVTTKRLDDLLSDTNLQNVDLVKLDVELAEPQVLAGMGTYLSQCKPTLLIEILTEQVAREVSDLTRNLGYNIFRVIEQRGLVRTSEIEATEIKERNYLLAQDKVVNAAAICDFIS